MRGLRAKERGKGVDFFERACRVTNAHSTSKVRRINGIIPSFTCPGPAQGALHPRHHRPRQWPEVRRLKLIKVIPRGSYRPMWDTVYCTLWFHAKNRALDRAQSAGWWTN